MSKQKELEVIKPIPALCKVEDTLDIFTGKWKTMILLELLHGGTKRFGELKVALSGISQKMLTAQLRELEEHDIVERIVYPEVPLRVEYKISSYGRSIEPILRMMHEWGQLHAERRQKKLLGKN